MIPEFTINDRLRKAREIAGLEQSELADRMGVSRGTVGNNESGKVSVRPITIKAWALATGVDAHWLETGNPQISPDDGAGVTVSETESATLYTLRAAA